MKQFKFVLAVLSLALPLGLAYAQSPGTPTGPGPHGGMMQGKGPGGMCCSKADTHGWALMSAEERNAHRDKMTSIKSFDECKSYHDEHRKTIEERAKAQGKALAKPRVDMCERMKSRGYLK